MAPVLETLDRDFNLQAEDISLREALRSPRTLAERARDAHILGHGAASLAKLSELRSVTLVAGVEPQLISNLLAGEARIVSGTPVTRGSLKRGVGKVREYMNEPFANTRSLPEIARPSSLDILARVCQEQEVPGLYVAMEHDELGGLSQKQIALGLPSAVAFCEVTGRLATHDYLLDNPAPVLSEIGFGQQLG